MCERQNLTVAYRSFYGEWRELDQPDLSSALKAFHRSGVLNHLGAVDAVVVNGEGTIHHGRGRHLLTILRGAQALGLRTALINAVLQAVDVEDFNTLHQLSDLTVRDACSSSYLSSLGIKHRVVFDSIAEAGFLLEPSGDFAGKIIVTDWHGGRLDVGTALRELLAVLGSDRSVFYPLADGARADLWPRALADFRQARLVVTGRHHGVCLALMAGVPFIACGSNTWKVQGLLDLIPDAARRSVDAARRWVEDQRPLTTFDRLLAA